MKELKFRAWDKEFRMMSNIISPFINGQSFFFFDGIGSRAINHEKLIVMQYTGLKDKNGKEIYEGDIIGMNNEAIGAVKWENFTSRFIIDGDGISGLRRDEIKTWGWTIIGNIYENPELIEKVEE